MVNFLKWLENSIDRRNEIINNSGLRVAQVEDLDLVVRGKDTYITYHTVNATKELVKQETMLKEMKKQKSHEARDAVGASSNWNPSSGLNKESYMRGLKYNIKTIKEMNSPQALEDRYNRQIAWAKSLGCPGSENL